MIKIEAQKTPYVKLVNRCKTYYIRRTHFEWMQEKGRLTKNREGDSLPATNELMFASDFVTEPAADFVYYDDVTAPVGSQLLRLVKNRLGENGILVTQQYVDKLLEVQGKVNEATEAIYREAGMLK